MSARHIPSKEMINFMWAILTLIPPILIATKRYGIGTDYFSYKAIYDNYSRVEFIPFTKLSIEYGFYLINYLASQVFNGFYGVLFLSSLITLSFIFLAINKFIYQISITFALFITYFVFYPPMLNAIRQMIAVAIAMYSYHFIIERKLLKYIFCIIIASFFHYTALICIPFYLLGIKTGKGILVVKRTIFYFFCIIIVIALPILLGKITNIAYFNYYMNLYNIGSNAKVLNQIILRLPVMIPIIIFSQKLIKADNRYEFYFMLFFIELIFIFLGSYYPRGIRLAYYTMPTQIILIPAIIRNIYDKRQKILVSLYFIIWYVIYFLYIFMFKGNDGIFPYKFL